jgi:multidrug efflux pump subunit AcrB
MGAIMVIGIAHKNGILTLDSKRHFTARGLNWKPASHTRART